MSVNINERTLKIARYVSGLIESLADRRLVVNLGAGIPVLTNEFLDLSKVTVHSENGWLGVGPLSPEGKGDKDLINAAMTGAEEEPGSCYFDMSLSFGLIRGGHIDISVLGAFEVSEHADIANWILPGKLLGVGGAMDLATGAKTRIVAMTQTSKGRPKMVRTCSLPVTAYGAADYVVTENGIFHFVDGRFVLEAIACGVSPAEVRRSVEFEIRLSRALRQLDA